MHRLATSTMLALGMLAIFGAMTLSHADERRERAEALEHEASSLAEQGFREEAETLRDEAEELLEAAAGYGREQRGEERDHLEREVEELHRHLDGLHKEYEELSRTDKVDARRRVEHEIGEVKREIAELLKQTLRGRLERDDDRHRELRKLHLHLDELITKREELAHTDDLDARRRVDKQIELTKREIAELEEHSVKAERRRADRDRPHGEFDAIARRIEHLHRAADHLAEAGEHDLAHELHARAEEMEQDLHRREDREAEHGGGHPELREILAEIRGLRHDVERLRDEMNEQRELVEQK